MKLKLKLMILAVGLLPMLLCNCASTVADHVPAARGTATGQIKVDALTSVSTSSRIAPVCSGPSCAPSRNSVATATTWATSSEGIVVTTNRMSKVEGFNQVTSGVGNLGQGVGLTGIGFGAVKGKLGTRVSSSSESSASVRQEGCGWY